MDNNLEKLDFLKEFFDLVRIVDPIQKKVVSTNKYNEYVSFEEFGCYEFWGRNKVCNNCISIRAHILKKEMIKIEYNGEKIYMITSKSIIHSNKEYVIEVLKDITNSNIIGELIDKDGNYIQKYIDSQNDLLVKDELTGVFNRKFINERMPYELAYCIMENNKNCIAMVDIDFFKKVNDTYGHLAGDYVLKEFCREINENLREDIDWIARYGGEEFIIFIKNIDEDKSYLKLESIRQKIQKLNIFYKDKQINITASFGAVILDGAKMSNDIKIDQLLEQADENLYKSKNSGRNKITLSKL